MNPDTIGCVWTGELDLNTLRVDGEIFESGKKKLRIQNYPDTCLGPVLTYPDIFESATFSFRIRLPSTRIRRIRQRIRKKINPLSRVEKNKSATNPITCGRVNPDIFESDDVKSVSSLSPNNKPIWRNHASGEQSILKPLFLQYRQKEIFKPIIINDNFYKRLVNEDYVMYQFSLTVP